jgi:hypothetical protein
MDDLTPDAEQLVREILKIAGTPPHVIEKHLREYREGSDHVHELRGYLAVLASDDPVFVLARVLMDELRELPLPTRLSKITQIAMMLKMMSELS